jgi:hypothetical protein
MSKWEELEKAARAATPGPWGHEEIDPSDPEWGASEVFTEGSDNYVATHVCSVKDAAYIAAANPSAILELLAERDALKAELDRHVSALDQEMVVSHLGVFNKGDDPAEAINKLMLWSQGVGDYFGRQAELDRIKAMEPVAWMRDDGEDGSASTMTNCCSAKVKDVWSKANPTQVERYTIPLYTLEKP